MSDYLPQSLEIICDQLDRHGIEITDIDEDEDNPEYTQVRADYGGNFIYFEDARYPGVECAVVSYPYYVVYPIARSLNESVQDQLVSEFEPDEWEDVSQSEYERLVEEDPELIAGVQALKSVPDSEFSEFVYRLREVINSPQTMYKFHSWDSVVFAFEVKSRIYTSDLTAKEMMESAQATVSQGHLGKQLVRHIFPDTYEIGDDEEESLSGQTSVFQL